MQLFKNEMLTLIWNKYLESNDVILSFSQRYCMSVIRILDVVRASSLLAASSRDGDDGDVMMCVEIINP